ncbi:20175_t:CDS:2 [Dentiscutata erythropus]|uniref:20175_t:CDS:1 n=1 Tax=Dentiscutata erythropus TaxID=1348616 RepID=A0A9N9IKT0_9GLOM|nr:20175_t:CDS:2 [Dentiscutata erythropus]
MPKSNVRVHESTIIRILQNKNKWLTTEIIKPEKKRNRAVTIPALELTLNEFILTYQHRTILSDAMLIEKAKLLASELGVSKDTEESEDEVSLEDPLLEELSKNIEDLNFSNPMRVEEYLNNPDEDIVYKIPDDDQIISDLVKTFGERSGKIENNLEEVDDSVEEEIISPNDALKSLENIHTFLFQQESASECINLVSVIEKFINVKKKDSMKQSTISRYFNEVLQSTDQDDWMKIFA